MKSLKVNIGLTNPKNPGNVASVMRAAGCYQVDAVFYTGTRYARAKQCNPDTKNIIEKIPLSGVACLIKDTAQDTIIVCVEFADGAIPLTSYQHPDKAFYIFGPEDGTIEQEIIDQADDVVYIPTVGCMNLAATVNVVLYDRLAKSASALPTEGNQFIRQSRDTNNTVKVKAHT